MHKQEEPHITILNSFTNQYDFVKAFLCPNFLDPSSGTTWTCEDGRQIVLYKALAHKTYFPATERDRKRLVFYTGQILERINRLPTEIKDLVVLDGPKQQNDGHVVTVGRSTRNLELRLNCMGEYYMSSIVMTSSDDNRRETFPLPHMESIDKATKTELDLAQALALQHLRLSQYLSKK